LAHTAGPEQAKAFIQQVKQQHPQARHHCWAYIAAAPNNAIDIGCSDDGEPSGTAGRPMLAQLQGANVGEICAVVTRYSGGIKLGTGGLVKAYGGSVQQALSMLETSTKQLTAQLIIRFSYAQQNVVQHILDAAQAIVINQDFSDVVTFETQVPVSKMREVRQRLVDKSKGQITFKNDR